MLAFGLPFVARAGESKPVGQIIATDAGSLTVYPIEHSTVVLQHEGVTVYVDPVGGSRKFSKFPRPDIVLITDYHGDHLDWETVKGVVSSKTRIVAPRVVFREELNKLKKLNRSRKSKKPKELRGLKEEVEIFGNGRTAFFGGIEIKAIPMYNLTSDRARFHTKGRGNGYVINFDGLRVYISGDTEDIPEMRQLESIDVAFVCMNSPYTMEVEQAASAVLEFKPRHVIPFHYRSRDGTFSDVKKFGELVAEDPDIKVHLLDWYP